MNNHIIDRFTHPFLIGFVVIISYFLLMFGNGIVSLTHPDEVFYIQSAKEMLAHNSWLTPMIFDKAQFEKPFLPFALFMIAMKIFGLTAFAGRFMPSLFGIIGVLVVYWIAWVLFKSKRVAVLSGLILSSSFIYLALSRAVLTDMIFSVFISLSLALFVHGFYNRKYRHSGVTLWLVFAAIAVLTKGLLGILFSVTPAVLFLAYKREITFLKSISFLWGILLFCIITLPWHILMFIRHGNWFLEEYFYNVHWRRILMSEHPRLDNWYFYLMLMFVGIMPWFLFWIPTLRCVYRQFKNKLASRDKLFFLCVWMLSVYVFVQPAHSKLASYLFPAFPAIAILLAYSINSALDRNTQGEEIKLFRTMSFIMPFFMVVIAVGGVFVAKMYPEIILDMRPIYLSALLLSITALMIFLFNIKKMYLAMVISYLGITVTLLTGAYFSRSFIEPWVSCKGISDVLQSMDQSKTPVLASKFYVRGVRYYTDRDMAVIDMRGKGFWSPHPIPVVHTDHGVDLFLEQRPVTWAVLKEGDVRELERIFMYYGDYTMQEMGNIGGKYAMKIVNNNWGKIK